jgi:hypothetical protein
LKGFDADMVILLFQWVNLILAICGLRKPNESYHNSLNLQPAPGAGKGRIFRAGAEIGCAMADEAEIQKVGLNWRGNDEQNWRELCRCYQKRYCLSQDQSQGIADPCACGGRSKDHPHGLWHVAGEICISILLIASKKGKLFF